MSEAHARPLIGPVPTGTTVAQWTVICELPRRYGTLRYLLCRCVCGNERAVFIGNLRIGKSNSCGCVTTKRTHGRSHTRDYRAWQAMIQRCHNPRSDSFKNYGARGIQVCPRWRESFADFVSDMGPRPKDHSLDRINNDGDYQPDNCRWASRKTQNNNTRWTPERRREQGRRNAMKRWHPELLQNSSS